MLSQLLCAIILFFYLNLELAFIFPMEHIANGIIWSVGFGQLLFPFSFTVVGRSVYVVREEGVHMEWDNSEYFIV